MLVLKSMGQLVSQGARGFKLLELRHGISISLRQRNRDRPIDDDDVLLAGVIEAG